MQIVYLLDVCPQPVVGVARYPQPFVGVARYPQPFVGVARYPQMPLLMRGCWCPAAQNSVFLRHDSKHCRC